MVAAVWVRKGGYPGEPLSVLYSWVCDGHRAIGLGSAHTYIDTYMHTHTYIHTYIHTCIHTYMHAYTHLLTYIHAQISLFQKKPLFFKGHIFLLFIGILVGYIVARAHTYTWDTVT